VGVAAVTVAVLLVVALVTLIGRARDRSTTAGAATATAGSDSVAGGPGAAAGAPIALAVLPFDDGGAASRRYFADGITDEVRGKLASLPGLVVIAGGSSDQYRQTTKSPAEIGRELGVRYLLVGRIEWQERPGHPARVRVAPELVQVAGVRTPTTRWAHPFDADLSDVFRVQGEIAEQVATALDVTIGQSARTTLEARPTRSLPAYDAFLRGEAIRATSGSNAAALRRARAAYDSAVGLDSSFALAWAEMSITSSLLFHDETPQPADRDRARVAADRALALDPSLPDGYRALGDYDRLCLDDIRTAGATYRRGLAIAPRSVPLLAASARAERSEGRWDDAVARYRDAELLDPRDAGIADALAFAELYRRHYGEAGSAADRARQLAPSNPRYWETAAMIALAQGQLDSARAVLGRAAAAVGDTTLIAYVAQYADLYWVLDDRQQRALLAFTPAPFDGDRVGWGLALAGTAWVRGDRVVARAYADTARLAAMAALARTPDDAQTHAQLGVALAYLGDSAAAIREGARASALAPIARDAYDGVYYQHQIARIHALLGDGPGTAAALAPVLAVPYYVSRAWIAIDPTFAAVRETPSLRNLMATR
jgi:serine/threonine-protein kinase